MKKLLSFILFTLCITLSVNAQKTIPFGIKGGVNISNMTSDGFAKAENKTMFHIGVLTEFSISDKFSIQPEILFSQQGTKAIEIVYGPGIHEYEYTLNYIQVPVLAKFYFSNQFSLEVGPSFNFLVNDKVVSNSGYTEENVGKTFEFSGALGVSYTLKNGFFTSLRYTRGFTNVIYNDAKNNSFQLGIGFFF